MDAYTVKRGDYWKGPQVILTMVPGTDLTSAVVRAQIRKTATAATVIHDFITANHATITYDTVAGSVSILLWLPESVTTVLKGDYVSDVEVSKTSVLATTTIYEFSLSFIADVSRP
jgi:hypothetical protein